MTSDEDHIKRAIDGGGPVIIKNADGSSKLWTAPPLTGTFTIDPESMPAFEAWVGELEADPIHQAALAEWTRQREAAIRTAITERIGSDWTVEEMKTRLTYRPGEGGSETLFLDDVILIVFLEPELAEENGKTVWRQRTQSYR